MMLWCATGRLNCYPFFRNDLARGLGLPVLPEADIKDTRDLEPRITNADKIVVISTFPRLKTQSKFPDHAPKSTQSRLCRSIIPTTGDEDHSIAFIGAARRAPSLPKSNLCGCTLFEWEFKTSGLREDERQGCTGYGMEKEEILRRWIYLHF